MRSHMILELNQFCPFLRSVLWVATLGLRAQCLCRVKGFFHLVWWRELLRWGELGIGHGERRVQALVGDRQGCLAGEVCSLLQVYQHHQWPRRPVAPVEWGGCARIYQVRSRSRPSACIGTHCLQTLILSVCGCVGVCVCLFSIFWGLEGLAPFMCCGSPIVMLSIKGRGIEVWLLQWMVKLCLCRFCCLESVGPCKLLWSCIFRTAILYLLLRACVVSS